MNIRTDERPNEFLFPGLAGVFGCTAAEARPTGGGSTVHFQADCSGRRMPSRTRPPHKPGQNSFRPFGQVSRLYEPRRELLTRDHLGKGSTHNKRTGLHQHLNPAQEGPSFEKPGSRYFTRQP